MKKLMIAAAIVCAAVVSQAASVDWNYTGTSAEENFTVYCIAGAVQASWDSLSAVQAAALPVDGSATVGSRGRGAYGTGDVTSGGSALTTDSGYFFVVVNDSEDKFGVMAGDSSKVYDPEAQQTSPGTFNFSGVATTSSFAAVPEPTSGLLLLLGVAGLALKRKRA